MPTFDDENDTDIREQARLDAQRIELAYWLYMHRDKLGRTKEDIAEVTGLTYQECRDRRRSISGNTPNKLSRAARIADVQITGSCEPKYLPAPDPDGESGNPD